MLRGATPPSVLLIDGNADSSELYRIAFRDAGFRLLDTHSATTTRPDVIVVGDDDEMGGDTLTFVRKWRSTEGATRTPIICVTAYAFGARADEIKEVGCDLVLVMPVAPTILTAHVARLAAGTKTATRAESPSDREHPPRRPAKG